MLYRECCGSKQRLLSFHRVLEIVAGSRDCYPDGQNKRPYGNVRLSPFDKHHHAWFSHWRFLQHVVDAYVNDNDVVVEFGSGWGSTPLLHLMCQDRWDLFTIETDICWQQQFEFLFCNRHRLLAGEYAGYSAEYFGRIRVAFVDHGPHERDRIPTIEHYRDGTDVFVVHDYDFTPFDRQIDALNFKYNKVHRSDTRSTIALSDVVPVHLMKDVQRREFERLPT